MDNTLMRMTHTQKSVAASKKFKMRKRKTESNTWESDIKSKCTIRKDFDSKTQTSVNTISARVSPETLNSDQTIDDLNSVCVKIETDEWTAWYNTASDFYSVCAKSEQVLWEERHPDCNKQDGFTSECVKSEQTECEVLRQDVTRQACYNSLCVNKNTTSNSNAQDELHSVCGTTQQSLNPITNQGYITTKDFNNECGIAKQYIKTETDIENTTANTSKHSKTPENQDKLADQNSVYLTREEIELSNVDEYCAKSAVGGGTIQMDQYSNLNVPRHSNSEKDDSFSFICYRNNHGWRAIWGHSDYEGGGDEEACSEPLSSNALLEKDTSSHTSGYKYREERASVRGNEGGGDKEACSEPLSSNALLEKDTSSRTSGYKYREERASVRGNEGGGDEEACSEPSNALLEKDTSSRTSGYKYREERASSCESDVSESESLDDTDNDPDFSLESNYVSDSSSDTFEVIQETGFSARTIKNKSSTSVKLPSNKQKTVYRSNNDVSSTTDGASNRNAKITVQTSNNENGRKWDKTQYCLFCEKGYTNITKHYLKSHKTETEVQKILCMPIKSKERTAKWTRLRNAGNYKHNVSVLKEESGEFVVVARQSHDTKPEDYLPCDDCLGFFQREGLWRHKQVCPLRTGKQKSRRVQADAALLLPASNTIHAGLKENVFGKMVKDEVTLAARNDTIILKVGEKLYQKHGHLPHLYSHISQKMRELGRFLICSKTQDLSICCLNDILRPEKFPLAVQSTKALCEFNEVTNSYKNPSLALKIGHLLKKCSKVAKSEALINGDVERGSRADNFLAVCNDKWADEISSCALETLTRNKMNKGHLLPGEDPESSDTDHDVPIRQPHAKPGPSTTVTMSGQPKRLQKLSEDQSHLLKTLFKTNIALRKELKREDCERVMQKYQILRGLSWKKIKNTIHNWITAEKRKTKMIL
ncbi:uncharacterized protein LOC127856165 isoform X13 [Dreissena polymorpha]|uniref:uncharacterized protein LOC127856165 isoform X12 n=1 Tax=Dreissena polymorpha TaxID=45954 RepID=UPI0022645791|nr:uncharacterized protein LOC127856165 isoform X12 [Dreissena polymorpha]XP_052248171.1 uncharacterized protein LOC127856165 isoform X13 [Dreissena polymorpha]